MTGGSRPPSSISQLRLGFQDSLIDYAALVRRIAGLSEIFGCACLRRLDCSELGGLSRLGNVNRIDPTEIVLFDAPRGRNARLHGIAMMLPKLISATATKVTR
jgi:hypothetical protein